MKLLCTLFVTCIVLSFIGPSAKAQEPDFFRLYLQSKYPACYTSDGMGGWVIDPNCPDIVQEDSLDADGVFSGMEFTNFPVNVVDLQYFTSLKYLNLSNNKLANIEAFPPALEKLEMRKSYFGGPLQGPYFYSLPATLQYFNCDSSFIGALPALPETIKYLNCAHNKLRNLPALPPLLETLICHSQLEYEERYPELAVLPALPATLEYLDCHDNALASLPALPPLLKYLDCSHQWVGGGGLAPGESRRTLLALPNLPAGLVNFNCKDNALTQLPSLATSLQYLDCSGNKAVIQNFSQPMAYVGISSLPPLPANLRTLDCSANALNCIPRIPPSLSTLTLDSNRITCLPNTGNYTVLPAGPPLPICAATNNVNQCAAEAAITGRVFFDANSNGVKDATERYCAAVPVHLSNGLVTYTNDTGYYILNTNLGNYTLRAMAPAYLHVNPDSIQYNVTTYDTTVRALIALQPNRAFDTARVQLVPSAARPGFNYDVQVKFENVGTTVINADVLVTFDGDRLTFIEASNPAVSRTGNQLRLSVSNLAPRMQMAFTAHFNTLVSGTLGDTLITYASISANGNVSLDSSISIVTGSFDPNDKAATPGLSTSQVNEGTFINYLVRFQNTGTDTAFNIVITDTLSSQLDPASFELLGSSHASKVTLEGNKIAFEFLNILLPDSNINESLSHGYVQFRVKPYAATMPGATIPNQAFIYFDYNDPVETNIATTKVVEAAITKYSFIGNGNWNNPANWQGGNIPPAVLQSAVQIEIKPVAGGACIVNVPVTISNQSSLVVAPDAKLIVQGNLRVNR